MDEIKHGISSIFFYGLAVVVCLFTLMNNWDALMLATGGLVWMTIFGLALFEGGCIAWLIYFIKGAKGKWQRVAALVGSTLDLALTIASASIHLSMRLDTSWNSWTTGVIIVAMLINAALLWVAHLASPHSLMAINLQNYEDTTMALAFKKAKAKADATADEIATQIATALVEGVHGNMKSQHKLLASNGDKPPELKNS